MRFPKSEFKILILILSELCLKSDGNMAKNIVLQNEMSEYCRRHVVSSVFLGRQVADSSAEVMHFSRLDLPYSCSISVRTQSGSNIVLVIISESESNIIRSCSEGHSQLLIYEMGETFGGYWAALPKSVFQQEPQNQSTYYTLKTTKGVTKKLDFGITDYDTENFMENIVSLTTPQEETEDGYVVMEVPLVNVSGNIQLGETESIPVSDQNELFDLIYDVTPRNGVLYETSVLPLVKFSIWKQKGRREGLGDTEPRYQLDYHFNEFTLDPRLIFRTHSYRRKFFNRPYFSTRRIKFKKQSKEIFAANQWSSRIHPHKEYITKIITTASLKEEKSKDLITLKNHSDTRALINRYLKLLKDNNSTTPPEILDNEALTLMKRISYMKHNASVYLQQNLSTFRERYSSSITEKKNVLRKQTMNSDNMTKISISTLPFRNTSTHQNKSSTISSNLTTRLSTAKVKIQIGIEGTTDNSLEKVTNAMLSSIIKQKEKNVTSTSVTHSEKEINKGATTEKLESGSLVDHESWENIVRVAPVMADLLNATTPLSPEKKYIPQKVVEHSVPIRRNRRKRFIQALSLNNHRPRQMTTKERAPTANRKRVQYDLYHLAEMVELEDDEILGRVGLHYFKNYVGPTMFNMCDFTEVKARQVYLFNSSRIVIAVSNFTMERLTIVMTEARVARASGCPAAHLECQVSGVRVCVHTMNACDGVPNCGSYDVYDEDRMMCGGLAGFHYSVWLAACTLLAVLLTLLYSVHYWLKRCIPKVSQAFFVYTDKSENILYLDTIMRSPNDFDGGARLVYHSSLYSNDDLSVESTKEDDRKVMNVIRRCLRFLCCKDKTKANDRYIDDQRQHDAPYNFYNEPKRKFSFAEAELRKIAAKPNRTRSVQTGDSLEMAHFKNIKNLDVNQKSQMRKEDSNSDKGMINLQESERELSYLRQIRGMSLTMQSSNEVSDKNLEHSAVKHPVNEEEVELRNTLYDRAGKRHGFHRKSLEQTKYEIHQEPQEQKRQAPKHLRFEERAMTIRPSDADLNENVNVYGRRKIHLNVNRSASTELDAIEEDEEAASTSGIDFRRFWGKGKKNKKKMQR